MKKAFFKDKQSGLIFDEDELLDAVEHDDNLDSFIYLGLFDYNLNDLNNTQKNKNDSDC